MGIKPMALALQAPTLSCSLLQEGKSNLMDSAYGFRYSDEKSDMNRIHASVSDASGQISYSPVKASCT